MHIFIDESGSFVPTTNEGAWCAVAAYVVPEAQLRSLGSVLSPLKLGAGLTIRDEVKLKNVSETAYISFLRRLNKLAGTLFCTACDLSTATHSDIVNHRDEQARRIIMYVDKMKYESGKASYRIISNQVGQLSGQLYLQLVCQVELVAQVIDRAILYYVQRRNQTLRQFIWNVDQKNTSKIDFEHAFERIAPGMLQSMSLERESIALIGGDYSPMKDYIYTEDDAPTYLRDQYGLDVEAVGGFNVGRILRKDLNFVDSKESTGVQVADLLVAGIRRVLRGEFRNQSLVARLLGSLMVQNLIGEQVPRLISLGPSGVVRGAAVQSVQLFNRNARKMLV